MNQLTRRRGLLAALLITLLFVGGTAQTPVDAAPVTYLRAPTLTYGTTQTWSAVGSGNCIFTGEASSYYGMNMRVRGWYSNCKYANPKRICIELHKESGAWASACDSYRTGNSAASFQQDWWGCQAGANYTLRITFQGVPSASGGVSYSWPITCRNYYPG